MTTTSAVVVLAAAGLASWLLRVLLITLVPAPRLPAGVRDALDHGGAAVPAALVAASLASGRGVTALVVPSPALLALVVAGLVMWRTRQLGTTVLAAMIAVWALVAVSSLL